MKNKGILLVLMIVIILSSIFYTNISANEPIIPTAAGDTIKQTFPDANLATAVADAVSGGDVDATLTSTMISGLTYLDASNRNITDATGIEHLTSLTLLRLERNQLASLPNTINNLSVLKHLNLGDNVLTSLPENITNMPSLEVLYLNSNQLENIPESINNLSSLTLLALPHNKLTQFPKNIDKLMNLEELSLDHNQLTIIPESISNLVKLEYLYLSYNKLNSVPNIFNSFPNLDTLWLNNNQLSLFPTTITELNKLVELRIQSNEITYLPEDMSGLSSLHYLVLEDNQLTSLPMSMSSLTGLWYTYLKGNLLPTNYSATLKNSGMGGTVADATQSKLKIKSTAIKKYTIYNESDYTNINLSSILEVNRNGLQVPVSSEHSFIFENYVDENNIPVNLDTYFKNGSVLKPGKIYAQVRATGVGFFPNTSENALTTEKVELDFRVQVTKYKLSFNLNGGQGIAPKSQLLSEGQKAVKPSNPSRAGYVFKEWNSAKDGSGQTWNFDSNTLSSSDITLYAQWTSKELPITGDNSGIILLSSFLVLIGGTLLSFNNRKYLK